MSEPAAVEPSVPRPPRRIVVAVGTVLLLVAVAAGSYLWGHHAGSNSADTVGAVAGRASATGHDAADVRFAQQMLPHHEQALAMVAMVDGRSRSSAVKALAAQIAAAQQPEIATMQGWLSEWGASQASGQMTGMMSGADMDQLAKLSGGGFDREFLTLMIRHHAGAVDMARSELSDGENADALALASSIQVTQSAQIEQMRALLS